MFRLFTYLKAKLLHALLIVAAQLTANPGKLRDIFKGGIIENPSIYFKILGFRPKQSSLFPLLALKKNRVSR